MIQAVYVDVLLTINFVITYFLLAVVNHLLSRKSRRVRMLLAALVGALSSLTIFLPYMGLLAEAGIKILVSAGMIFIANPFVSVRQFMKEGLAFFTANFLFAGIMLAIWVTFTPNRMLYYNGVVYFDISSGLLLVNIAIAYGLVWLFDRTVKASFVHSGRYDVTICLFGKRITLKGYMDSGNKLKDPFSNTPVIVCGWEELQEILPQELCQVLKAETLEQEVFLSWVPSLRERFRMIPYKAVGGKGILPAIQADFVQLSSGQRMSMIENVYLGLSQKPVGDESYQVLLNSTMMENKIQKVGVRS